MTAGMVAVPVIIPLKPPNALNKASRKWMIDTNTPIEIHCSTCDSLVFYTLDGTKPDPFKKIGERTTYQYQTAFTLKRGKQTVKAIAVLRNGLKESSVNTKVFHVDPAPKIVAPAATSDNEEENDLAKTSWTKHESSSENDESSDEGDRNEKKMFKKVIRTSLQHNEKKDPEEMISRVVTASEPPPSIRAQPNSPPYSSPVARDTNYPDTVLNCLHCGERRPRDPYARFCNGCRSVLPPAPGFVRISYRDTELDYEPCKNCGSVVPSDLYKCGICNEVLRKPNSTIENSRIKCEKCSSMNPTHVTECLVCESKLSNVVQKKPPTPTKSEEFIKCTKCTRINCENARFCDWCGEKCVNEEMRITCSSCSTGNSAHSQYCCNCGNKLPLPMRSSFHQTLEHMIRERDEPTMKLLESLTFHDDFRDTRSPRPSKARSPTPPRRRATKDVYIQAGESHIREAFLTNDPILAKQTPIIKPSPGKGFWRQQIEHVSQQMKIYAQSNVEFRESFSQYVLTGLKSVNYVADDEQLTLTTQFNVKQNKFKKKQKTITTNNDSGETLIQALLASKANVNYRPKSVDSSRASSAKSTRPNSARSSTSNSRPNSARSTTSTRSNSRKKKRANPSQKKLEQEKIARKLSKLSHENLQVLKILKSKKHPDVDDFKEFLKSENFDANALDENDTPLLKLCVKNNKSELIAPLLKAGVEINRVSGVKGNTALHECVLLGYNGKECLDVLLDHKKINFDVKDKKGRTAYDLALEGGIDAIINKFTKVMSRNLLNDVVKI